MSDYSSLVWEWNAKRQAINPNHVSDPQIEYLTPKGERKTLAYADLVDTVYRTPMRPREGAAREAFDRKGTRPLPAPPGSDSTGVYPQAVLSAPGIAGASRPKRAVRWLFSTFERHVLRRVDAVNAQYLPQAALPAILAPLRDDFHLPALGGQKSPETTRLISSPT